jgi:hypothetical protein
MISLNQKIAAIAKINKENLRIKPPFSTLCKVKANPVVKNQPPKAVIIGQGLLLTR